MKLSLADLRNLLYGFEVFDFQRPLSMHPHEYPLYKVKIVPIEVGVTLAAMDPKEDFFKVFNIFFAKPPRSEIWHKRAWDESLTKRCGYKPRLGNDDGTVTVHVSLHDRVQNLTYDLTHALALSGIHHKSAKIYAEQFVYGPTLDKQLLSVTAVNADLMKRLEQIRDLLAKETTETTPTPAQQTNEHQPDHCPDQNK